METIYALSSGGLPSGVAIVRVSGSRCRDVVQALCSSIPENRFAALRPIRDRNGTIIDTGLLVFFQGPGSFTGEDCAEFHVHGGKAVVSALLNELAMMPGTRHAEAGEFSKRAFQSGKLDLVEVEGLADLIAADTEMQRRLAQEHASGGQSAIYETWADRLTHARAMIEAEIDFVDEDDIPGSVSDVVWADMRQLLLDISHHLDRARIGEIIRDGLKVAIAGAPNVGKSSFLNALAKRDVAIVTNIAGTTRDVLTVDLDLEGFAVKVYDTAGIRVATDIVEAEGIRRARAVIADADLVLLLEDSDDSAVDIVSSPSKTIRVRTKIDLLSKRYEGIGISTVTGEGFNGLASLISDYLANLVAGSIASVPTRQRHVQHLTSVAENLRNCLEATGEGLDIQTEYLRIAAQYLGRVTGRVDVEQLLDVIFANFCVGK